MSIPISLAV